MKHRTFVPLGFLLIVLCSCTPNPVRTRLDFNAGWKFHSVNDSLATRCDYNDTEWRILNLPHDWSIEGAFSNEHSTRPAGGALPAGMGWYRKTFRLDPSEKDRLFFIDFDGVYRNSEVWINEQRLGKRASGYMGFRYELTPFLHFGDSLNVLAVKVDNSRQPNSRWYTGSGIYRNVWLVSTGKAYVEHWGVSVSTPEVSEREARIRIVTRVSHQMKAPAEIVLRSTLLSPEGQKIQSQSDTVTNEAGGEMFIQHFTLEKPALWSFATPVLYTLRTEIFSHGIPTDALETPFGIRTFHFDSEKGFFLNGENIKLKGVNNHHDLGALGAAFNKRAAERQLEILKEMGCNALRTAHNPPAPELLDLCDQMGFFVMDEAFDVWAKKKTKYDYHEDWDEWHTRDLQDMVLRDRNHPSVMVWSIGNEIREQFDSTGLRITPELVRAVKAIDPARPVTCALTENLPGKNFIYQSGALDVLSFNYKHHDYPLLPERFPGETFIASENMSAFASRGVYNQPSDSIRIWPEAYNVPIKNPNPDYTCSAYDQVHAYWGATHEDTWKTVKKLDFISGMFIWSGFDFLGEPEPYGWPAKSSYYGVIDLCGFPKDAYFFYKSEWTNPAMLHLFPHWNWTVGDTIDVWAYYNHADEAELFVNGRSQGIRHKTDETLHALWRVGYFPGSIRAITRKDGQVVMEKEIPTAGEAAKIELTPDRREISADGYDLSFVTVKVLDKEGNLVPNAHHLIEFEIDGAGFLAGVDNGYQASHEPFKTPSRKAFNGMCLAIVQSNGTKGKIRIKAHSEGLESDEIKIRTK
ncbi:MAG TPA: glycoside hydrolase family 2 TIM barrel-domain containing protein [Prolixibacteraceae bacterium]|nr:glycoside hydrolase family 2 TIM barrel-domain containing protein [Prolixibacteraceae bacterium]